ncbi:hypothetical protein D3C81_225910 [compost metagenome]|uniref:Uncharacterized protein n=1 Tax=Paenibacillus stellifer TaxID=169760 RepID=A0A089LMF2_9BACL|nr:hypothetical protein [Paenibacillus stellifer]AIQ62062.1 hypothetical protein PSTEL_01900 [Paenibacillus stellifer]
MFPDHPKSNSEKAREISFLAHDEPEEYQPRNARAAVKPGDYAGERLLNALIAFGATAAVFILFLWLMNLVR